MLPNDASTRHRPTPPPLNTARRHPSLPAAATRPVAARSCSSTLPPLDSMQGPAHPPVPRVSLSILFLVSLCLSRAATTLDLPLLRGSPSVLQVVPDEVFQLHTTRTPEFLGLLAPARRRRRGCSASQFIRSARLQ
ncbi:hypothetical protein E2562_033532 [Oryza meyeriana var. granulata]|uniref:Uncharacterized protein n=1 Tax=Oryza meyeriana var. granulata TaxID=110450 RepID=A0A6G1ES21_9ORYZ|nr:hypothetical protein E2562_033532 [Oryza meyeriana var. granulata]